MQPFIIQDLTIVLAAKHHNPSILNPDFLRFNHIIPENWELAAPPVCFGPLAQVVYANSTNITAQAERVSFNEPIAGKALNSISIPDVALKYVTTLKHVNYQAIGINPAGHFPFSEGQESEARAFIADKFLNPSLDKRIQYPLSAAGVKLGFPVDPWTLALNIEEGTVQMPGKPPEPAVLVKANFHKNLTGNSVSERLKDLTQTLSRWQDALASFQKLVNDLV